MLQSRAEGKPDGLAAAEQREQRRLDASCRDWPARGVAGVFVFGLCGDGLRCGGRRSRELKGLVGCRLGREQSREMETERCLICSESGQKEGAATS